MSSAMASGRLDRHRGSWIRYNGFLERNASLARLNEGFLDERRKELDNVPQDDPALYWLTYARLNELALYCAGNYTDNFEFSSAGDLLVNPRRILVHIRNRSGAVVKERRGNLTEQFGGMAENREGVIRWLKRETTLETKEKPLLPLFLENLVRSERMSDGYLESIRNRMRKIGDAIGFFGCMNFVDSHEFYLRLQNTPEEEKAFIRSKFCRFDTKTFDALGSEISRAVGRGDGRSAFLKTH
ncbi:MAG TPA: hypothetical protein PKL99_04460 [Syntrophales bacterium]|nr:hypothetical protein [Syntrophales bacterium]